MTQQEIFLYKSDDDSRDSFISHIEQAIFQKYHSLNKIKLDNLHNTDFYNKELLKQGTDQSTIFHKLVYSTFDEPSYFSSIFWKNYKKLSLDIIETLKKKTGYHEEWSVQRFPTIRFHFPNNISVFEFHRDANYSHPIGEINCFYALNECKNTSALHVEKNLGFEDYSPLNLQSGEYALLNTSIYKHGDFLNKTNKTRVSMDFRFIPKKHLKNAKSSLTTRKKFTSDSYFLNQSEMEKI